MNTSEQEKYRDLAKLTGEKLVPAGHVYIGFGIDSGLNTIFGKGNITCYCMESGLDWRFGDRNGCIEGAQYAVTVATWEKTMGIKYRPEEKEEKKTQTIFHAEHIDGLGAVALAILKRKDIEVYERFLKPGASRCLFVNTLSSLVAGIDDAPNKKHQVSAGEFIKVLESLPDKITEVRYSIGSLDVLIDNDGVRIGCQRYSQEEIAGLSKIVLAAYDERKIALEGRSVISLVPQEIAIVCDGNKFNKNDLLVLNEKIDEFNKLNS